jgi:hypothetical protein
MSKWFRPALSSAANRPSATPEILRAVGTPVVHSKRRVSTARSAYIQLVLNVSSVASRSAAPRESSNVRAAQSAAVVNNAIRTGLQTGLERTLC